jgi:hypothetical protein
MQFEELNAITAPSDGDYLIWVGAGATATIVIGVTIFLAVTC